MRKCLFCPSTETLTKEHVFPQWIWRLYHQKPQPNRYSIVSTATKRRPIKRRAATIDMQVRIACRNCNNGWMSRFENDIAKPTLGSYIRHGELERSISPDEEVGLVAWAMKMAFVLDFTTVNRSPHYNDEQRYAFVNDFLPPERTWIWVANYVPDRNRRTHTSITNLRFIKKDDPEFFYKAQVSTFAAGNLAFQVLHTYAETDAPPFEWRAATRNRPEKATIQLWPAGDRRMQWPPEEYFDDLALQTFGERFGCAPNDDSSTEVT